MIAIGVAWLAGELAGGLAARRIVLGGQSVAGAVLGAIRDVLGRSLGAVLAALLTTIVLVLEIGASLIAVALAWTAARSQLADLLPDPLILGLALMALAAAWCLALVVTGLSSAWRSVAMTFEAERASTPTPISAGPGASATGTESTTDS